MVAGSRHLATRLRRPALVGRRPSAEIEPVAIRMSPPHSVQTVTSFLKTRRSKKAQGFRLSGSCGREAAAHGAESGDGA